MSKKILVVEDDPVQQQRICTALQAVDAEIIVAANGQQGVSKAVEEKPDLILMDVVMPEVDGFAACRQITSGDTTREIPVVIVSSKNQEADKVWAQLQGAKAMISKPFSDQELVEQVNAFL
ncbi:response regulator [Amphritea pacifica]|uniref:response regulator n=1 Tax=Amphritea pacifica TaxID=2811233 RepID=UPI0019667930|nr:response regulator [Amphritea pacifica]MBN1005861.1 response regulator [Amphritea pacifica]